MHALMRNRSDCHPLTWDNVPAGPEVSFSFPTPRVFKSCFPLDSNPGLLTSLHHLTCGPDRPADWGDRCAAASGCVSFRS